MGAIGTCCCDPNCVDACEGVLPPTSVTLFPPFSLTGDEFELVEWDLTPIVDTDSACDTYQTSLVCAAETSWTMLRDIYCESDWPASNANDTAFALGTTHGCVFCSPGGYPSSYTTSYQESQYSSRTTYYHRKSYTPSLKIEPNGTAGMLRISLRVDYGEALSISQVEGIRNRIKIVTLTCSGSSATVTDLSAWNYADEPVLPVPLRCFPLGATFCDEQDIDNNVFNSGSCTEDFEDIGFDGCGTTNPIRLRTTVGTPWCNPDPFFTGVIGCEWIEQVGGISVRHQGYNAGSYTQFLFSVTWVGEVHCDELYDGPITLEGGPPSGIVDVSYGSIGGIPVYGDEDVSPCSYLSTPSRRRWAVPETISVEVNHA